MCDVVMKKEIEVESEKERLPGSLVASRETAPRVTCVGVIIILACLGQ